MIFLIHGEKYIQINEWLIGYAVPEMKLKYNTVPAIKVYTACKNDHDWRDTPVAGKVVEKKVIIILRGFQ